MKVAVVFSAAHRRGGVERVAWEALRHFGARHDTWFIGGELESPALLPAGVTHIDVGGAVAAAPRAFRDRAGAELARLSPDAAITLGANCPPGDVLMVQSVHRAWLHQGRPIPLGPLRLPARVRFLMPRHRRILRLEAGYFAAAAGRLVIPCGDGVAADLEHWYGVPPGAMHVLPNGFAADEFNLARRDRDRARVRADIGLGDGEICVLFVGNELHRKGFGPLLDALGRVADGRLRLHVVGRADPAAYRQAIGRNGLTDRLTWHGPTGDVARYFAAADLFVLPTQYEPFGIVIVEALAMGVPVITTKVAGAAAAVKAGRAGIVLSDPDDVEELTGALRSALVPGVLADWATRAPAAAAPYEWGSVFERLELLMGHP